VVVFDDHAHPHQHETLPFRRVRANETDLLAGILDGLAEEYAAARLPWHADEVRLAVMYVLVATRSYDRFVDAAAGLGRGHWRPVALLAETALAAGRRDTAADVFDTADQPGRLGDHLQSSTARCSGWPFGRAPPAGRGSGRSVASRSPTVPRVPSDHFDREAEPLADLADEWEQLWVVEWAGQLDLPAQLRGARLVERDRDRATSGGRRVEQPV
jgi:hypothetical protein